jgi:coenzyme F420-dependent glucose-6-phosphate dehydrogenase
MVIKFGSAIFNPKYASAVEEAGFDSIWVPDHFAPFSHDAGLRNPANSGGWMALPSLPLILSNTTRCAAGTNVLCPTFRYHPAIIAQYFAQLDYLFPGRTIMGVGTGEAVNETPIVGRFPPYQERMERLEEAVEVMRKLWTSEDYFDYQGKYYNLKNVFLYAKPKEKIPIVISAFGPKSAELSGKVGDGIIIHWARPQQKRNLILKRFVEAAVNAGKDPETMIKAAYFQGGITSDPLTVVRFAKASWSWGALSSIHEPDPRKVDEKAQQLSDEEVLKHCTLVQKVDDLIERFDSALKAGMNHLIIGDVTPGLVRFNLASPEDADWPKNVLPYLREKYE